MSKDIIELRESTQRKMRISYQDIKEHLMEAAVILKTNQKTLKEHLEIKLKEMDILVAFCTNADYYRARRCLQKSIQALDEGVHPSEVNSCIY